MFHLRLVGLLFFVSLQVAFSSSHNGFPFQQVPVCAPVPGSSLQGCPRVTHHLPRGNQVTDYVQYRRYVPSMKEGTVCSWIETTNYGYKFVLGYASPTGSDNEFSVELFSTDVVRFHVEGNYYDFRVPLSLSSFPKYHLCLTFSSTHNQRSLYLNGNLVETVSYQESSISGGGMLVLGQDHDSKTGGTFDPKQSFNGNITNLMIWPRVLTRLEILNIARICVCPVDFAVAMTLNRVEHHGEAYYSIPDQCPTV